MKITPIQQVILAQTLQTWEACKCSKDIPYKNLASNSLKDVLVLIFGISISPDIVTGIYNYTITSKDILQYCGIEIGSVNELLKYAIERMAENEH